MRRSTAGIIALGLALTACGGTEDEGTPSAPVAGGGPAPTPGSIVTVIGTGKPGVDGVGGPATEAELSGPTDLTFDDGGNLYIAERFNNRIVMVDPAGTLSLVAGNLDDPLVGGFSGDGGSATEAELDKAWGMAIGPDGNLYIADTGNNRIRMVDGDGIITTTAGTGEEGFSGDGGQAAEAELNEPVGLAFDSEGSLYIWDTGNFRIRKVDRDGIITTVAGTGDSDSAPDGTPAAEAGIRSPTDHAAGVAVDEAGRVYFTDLGSNRISMIDEQGLLRTVAGSGEGEPLGEGGPATEAGVIQPLDVAIGPDGILYLTTHTHGSGEGHRVRAVGGDGIITTMAGSETGGYSGDGAAATEAELNIPAAVAIGPDGNLYIADAGNNVIRMVEL